jgi:beta-mannanase
MKPLRSLACILALIALGLSLAAVPAQAASASISLSPAKGPAESTVTVTGTGFPKKSAGTLSAGGSSAAFKASATGYFTADVVIPQTTQLVLDVQAVSGTVKATAAFTVVAAPATEPSPPAISSAPLRFGVGNPGGPLASAELDQAASLAGEAPSVILSYKDFNQAPPITELDAVRSRGATTLLTWEPWTWGGGTDQPAYTLDRITAGNFDPYLRQWGVALASWGHPVMLRFGHEMNGNWYPWSEGINGNESGDYAAAWRHVHDVIAATGASNVTWVWNPNVPYSGSTPLEGLYPGPAYVDAVGLDGYNWGTSAAWSSWVSPSDLFGQGLSELRLLAPGKQVLVAETSSAEQGGSKADWNTALVSYLAAQTDVTAVVWFNFNKETDWRINSSPSSATALASALAARRK